MDRLATPLLLLFASLSGGACVHARGGWQRHFEAQGVRGTFVLREPRQDRFLAANESRGRSRFLPDSTFEIVCALVGLETGAVADEREAFAWDGRPRLRGAWERDQTLATALRDGTAWTFQEIARRIGKARMREWLERLDYGNGDIAGGVELFWLQGALRVSAFEQVAFLHRLAEGRLPATQRAQRLVREALRVERGRGYALYAKAGTSGHPREPVAWWVGWIEKQGRVEAVFAMNYEPRAGMPCDARFEIGRAILREAGALPSGSPPA